MGRTRETFSAMTQWLHDHGAIDDSVTAEELMVMLAFIDPVDANPGATTRPEAPAASNPSHYRQASGPGHPPVAGNVGI
jgi:hypothetical protein